MALEHVGDVDLPPHAKPGGFDHAAVHGGRGLLYVAHTAMDAVDVIDCTTNTYLRSIGGLPGVSGVLIDSEHDLLATSDRGAARVSLYRCSDERLLARIGVGPRP